MFYVFQLQTQMELFSVTEREPLHCVSLCLSRIILLSHTQDVISTNIAVLFFLCRGACAVSFACIAVDRCKSARKKLIFTFECGMSILNLIFFFSFSILWLRNFPVLAVYFYKLRFYY